MQFGFLLPLCSRAEADVEDVPHGRLEPRKP